MDFEYINDLFWIIGDDGEVIEEIGGFTEYLSPMIIILVRWMDALDYR